MAFVDGFCKPVDYPLGNANLELQAGNGSRPLGCQRIYALELVQAFLHFLVGTLVR